MSKEKIQKIIYVVSSFVAGFSIMVIELTSSRVVAPIIGSSVFTWTSVIGITLLGLSIGSYLGGKIADKNEKFNPLPLSFLVSSVFVFIITILVKNVDFITNSSDSILKLNLLIASYLFLLPAISIGTIQPIILKKYADNFLKIGSEYGTLSAVWSLGSIMGVFLTGFYFISTIGSMETITLISLILFIIGLLLAIKDRKGLYVFLFTSLLLPTHFLFTKADTVKNSNVIYQKETNYFNAKVIDAYLPGFGDSRILLLDTDSHSIESKEKNEFFYPELYPIFSYLKSDIKDLLAIGAGAYTIPKYFKDYYKNSNVSAIDIDPELEKISKAYFGLDTYDIKTIVGDARTIIKNSDKKYDVIFSDVYNSFISIPWYLLTKEFNEQIKTKLNNKGIYAINIIGSIRGPESNFTKSVLDTFKTSFPNYYIFAFGITPESVQNIILVGINGDLPLKPEILAKQIQQGKNSFLAKKIISENLLANSNSIILTDNFSPVEKLMTPIIEKYFPLNLQFNKKYGN
jgi:spermidine synthase